MRSCFARSCVCKNSLFFSRNDTNLGQVLMSSFLIRVITVSAIVTPWGESVKEPAPYFQKTAGNKHHPRGSNPRNQHTPKAGAAQAWWTERVRLNPHHCSLGCWPDEVFAIPKPQSTSIRHEQYWFPPDPIRLLGRPKWGNTHKLPTSTLHIW